MKKEIPDLLALHPKDLSDEEYLVYEPEFNKVFNDSFCRNVALSGPYGAGKSSVMEKVLKERNGLGEKWITVSLATFGGMDDCGATENSFSQSAVEAEVLRQMIHKIGTSKAPKSSFRKLIDRGRLFDAVVAALILAFICLTAYLASFPRELYSLQLCGVRGIALAIWLAIAGVGLYKLVRTKSFSRMIKRIKIFEAELEVTPSGSTSPYDRCVDEIVYLLNASHVNAIVFEDLDRFDSISIFEKMRSLNCLANDSRFCDAKKGKAVAPLRFFFLVRDGLFENPRDRTKFFDYVIPVIPYIDPNNALDIMRTSLNGVGISVDEGFLYQLSSYIDDPRIIHDIADEAYHYKKVLFAERSFSRGDPERLIALLAYKALFPRDFELLQVGRGYLYEVLNGKHRLIKAYEENAEEESAALRRELDEIDHQLKVSEDELICMFGAPMISAVSQHLSSVSAANTDPHSFLEKARNNHWASRGLQAIISELEDNDRYQARLLEVRGEKDRRSEVIRARLRRLEVEAEALRAKSIKQLIDELPDADALFYFEHDDLDREEDYEDLSMNEVVKSPSFPMLRFLVSSGFIDESYRRYISNFYSDSLCAEDDDFLSCIRQAKPVDSSYEPKSPREIVRRMDQGMFARQSIRIPWLVSSLLDSDEEWKIDEFMTSVMRADDVRFLARFIVSEQFNPKIFDKMFAYFNDPIAELLNDEGISPDDKRCFCKRYLTNGGDHVLYEEQDGAFIRYVNADSRFLEQDSRFDDSSIAERILQINYRAESIDFSCASSNLLDCVFDNRLFTPAPPIIEGFLHIKYGVSGGMAQGILISEALQLPDGPIKDVLSENMNYFVSSVVRESRVSLRDYPKFVVAVLNDDGVQAKTAEQYIDALADIEIGDISEVRSTGYRDMLLSALLVECNANNVLSFYRYSNDSISDNLARLIEVKGAPIDLTDAKCRSIGVDTADLMGEIVECESISPEVKNAVLKQCVFKFASLAIDSLEDGTIRTVIEANAIEMNGGMLDKFRLYKPNLTIDYILSDLDGFLALVGADSSDDPERMIEKDEVIALLESRVDIDKKLAALSCFDGVILLNENYDDEVNAAIIAEYISRDDLENLPLYYEKISDSYKDLVAKTLAKHADELIVDGIGFGWDLLCATLRHLKADRTQALRLLVRYCEKRGDGVSRGKMLRCFESAGLEDYQKLLKGSQRLISESSIDEDMLLYLNKLGMCGTISHEVNERGLRRVYPKGATKA